MDAPPAKRAKRRAAPHEHATADPAAGMALAGIDDGEFGEDGDGNADGDRMDGLDDAHDELDTEQDEAGLYVTTAEVDAEALALAAAYEAHLTRWRNPVIETPAVDADGDVDMVQARPQPKATKKSTKKANAAATAAVVQNARGTQEMPLMVCPHCRRALDETARLNGGLHKCPQIRYLFWHGRKRIKKKNFEIPILVTRDDRVGAPTMLCRLCDEWHSIMDQCPQDQGMDTAQAWG